MTLFKRTFTALLVIMILSLAMAVPALTVSAAAVPVTLYPTSGPPGTNVVILGNFMAGSTYSVTFGALTPVATGIVIAKGNVGAFDLPDLPRGTYSVIVTSSAGDTATLPLPTFTVSPQIFISSISGEVGDQIDINGNGFNANQNISINFGAINIASVTSNAQGVFPSTAITIPQSPAGSHLITAIDQSGASPGVSFGISPEVTMSASEGAVGSTLNISGTGFAGSELIAFYFHNKVIYAFDAPISTEPSGEFTNVSLVIPPVVGGSATIKIEDSSSDTATASYLVDSTIAVRPNSGPAGTKVTVDGNGFQSISNSPITITYNGTVITTSPASLIADGNGSFEANFIVPVAASGVATITAGNNLDTASSNFSVVVPPAIKSVANVIFSVLKGPVGTMVTATGTGFAGNAAVTIKYDNTPIGTDAADGAGNFTTTFTVPASGTGAHQLSITDQVSALTNTFNIASALNLNESSGVVGDNININGTGFTPSRDITVKWDNALVAATTTDATGTFVIEFKVPAGASGNHPITVADGTNTMNAIFMIVSTPPPIPALLSPPSATKASNTPTLEWQKVTDPNGVTYTLEISKDATFDILVLQEQGLTTPEYTLTKQQRLKATSQKQPYYWRGMAIDGANNQSTWSAPFTFYVGTVLAAWIYYAGAAILVLIVTFIVFLIEKRRTG
jgi:hypothetical protein